MAVPATAVAGVARCERVRINPLKNGGDHSFGSRFEPLRNRPTVFWCRLLDSWRQDGENSEKTEKKRAKMGEHSHLKRVRVADLFLMDRYSDLAITPAGAIGVHFVYTKGTAFMTIDPKSMLP